VSLNAFTSTRIASRSFWKSFSGVDAILGVLCAEQPMPMSLAAERAIVSMHTPARGSIVPSDNVEHHQGDDDDERYAE
jgi:hypothetical protein